MTRELGEKELLLLDKPTKKKIKMHWFFALKNPENCEKLLITD